jgi:hypothetical protein
MVVQLFTGGLGATQPGGATLTLTYTGGGESLNVTSFTSWSDNEVFFVMPAFTHSGLWRAAFTAGVETNPSPDFTTETGTFVITNISPFTATYGQTVTLTGTFPATQNAGFGFFIRAAGNEALLTPLSWNSTTITFALPATVPAGFSPGLVQILQLCEHSFDPVFFPSVVSQSLFLAVGYPSVQQITPSSGVVAPNQTLTIIGLGFGFTQGGTAVTFDTVRGGSITVVPTIWESGVYEGGTSQEIQLPTPSDADISTADYFYFVNGSLTLEVPVNVVAPLVLTTTPGANVNVGRGQSVELSGSGFGGGGALTYFSSNGLPTTVVPTDWTDTAIYTNIPSGADLGQGFFWAFPSGVPGEVFIFTGFTVTSQAAGPAQTLFATGQEVTALDTSGTYPIPPGALFPIGTVQGPGEGIGYYSVAWLNGSGTQNINTFGGNMTPIGGLCANTQTVIGTFVSQ